MTHSLRSPALLDSRLNLIISLQYDQIIMIVGHGGALVETMTFNQRVVGSTPALAAT